MYNDKCHFRQITIPIHTSMKKTPRSIPSKRRFPTLIIILVATASAIILLLLKNSDFDNKKTIPVQSSSGESPSAAVTTPIAQPSPTAHDIPQPPQEDLPTPKVTVPPQNSPCQDIYTSLHTACKHLNQQQYIKAYSPNEPVEAELNRIITKVLNNPPTNSNETADLLSVIRNSSHLFRVLGRKDLSFLKDIITNEHSSIEQHFASLYALATMDKACRDTSAIQFELPLAKTYEYAAFFLNTLGGQAYLSRRDPTVRTLAKYYAVLVLDQAASQSMNIYDINLAYHLDSVINDIKSSDFLENQDSYLTTLMKIKEREKH